MIYLRNQYEIDQMKRAGSALKEWMDSCMKNLEYAGYENGRQVEKEFNRFVHYQNTHHNVWDTVFNTQVNLRGEQFGHSVCVSVNDTITHGKPNDERFQVGDIVKVDAGLSYNGWIADMASTTIYGMNTSSNPPNPDHNLLTSRCVQAIQYALKVCKPGNKVNHISQKITEASGGLGIVREYMGHGIGMQLHEELRIPNVPDIFPQYKDIVLRPGMVFCLEPMFMLGSNDIVTEQDGWAIMTQDGSLAAHFEIQLAITNDGYEIIT